MERARNANNIIIITGAESTGKTQLAVQLAKHYSCNWVPEFSRSYVENLQRPYTLKDIEWIARQQIKQLNTAYNNHKLVFFDTSLIITKVWFQVVCNSYPDWLITAIKTSPKVLHLLCDTDLPWVADNVRENGGEMREQLHAIYKSELEQFGFPYVVVSGKGNERLKNAIRVINQKLSL